MPRKSMKPVNKEAEESPKQRISQSITNLCTIIGDKGFLIRETEAEVKRLYGEIDKLRQQLSAIAAEEGKKSNGSEISK